ncbi:MAG: hypothetical protein ABJQ71_07320 [Roseibium sp.]
MFRILIIIGLLFATASQGFARKVDVSVADPTEQVIATTLLGELAAPTCCDEKPVIESKSTYCKSDCKGVISTGLIVPLKASQVPDGASHSVRHSIIGYVEHGPPKR